MSSCVVCADLPRWLKQIISRVPVASTESRKIVVVGPCAAGKSTLVSALRASATTRMSRVRSTARSRRSGSIHNQMY